VGDTERRLHVAFFLILSVVCEGIFQHIILEILILQRKPETVRDRLSSRGSPGRVGALPCRLVYLTSAFPPDVLQGVSGWG